MRKALVPVDGSPNAERAVQHVISLARTCPSMEIVLINVQAPVDSWEARSFLKTSEIEALEESKGGDALASSRALLDAAQVNYTPLVLLGPVPETIARTALEQGCDGIVMGTRGMGAAASLLLGSVATKVIHLADVPVTLVK